MANIRGGGGGGLAHIISSAIPGYRNTGLQEYRGTGVQEYRSTRLQEYRGTGVQEYRSTGLQEYRGTGVQEYRSTRLQEYRGTGVQGHRSTGVWPTYMNTSSGNILISRVTCFDDLWRLKYMHVILQFAFEIVQLDKFDLLPSMFFHNPCLA